MEVVEVVEKIFWKPFLFATLVVLPTSAEPLFTPEIEDKQVILGREDILRIHAESRPYRFRVFTDTGDLEQKAKDRVDSRKTVVLAIDKERQKVFVRFGEDVGVRITDSDAISASGNAYFREKRWADGILAIMARVDR